ncbi:hypothetical protein AB0D14_08955 [Streptomyces sp. NPDC048484]|uniref:hypothetical protein n=1 Tax=Streptomyces sp. NPDC048484 TaxID=3155146 RepID=UPI0034253058
MPKYTLRNSLIAALAVSMLPALAACGGSSDDGKDGGSAAGSSTKTVNGATQLNVPEGTDAETKKLYIMENGIAACMKKQGFAYTPHVGSGATDSAAGSGDGQDYAAEKKERQKYGFGTYAATVYPDDTNAPGSNAGGKIEGKVVTPPDDDQKGMTPAQLTAYEVALNGPPAKTKAEEKDGGCYLVGHTKAYGPPLSAAAEKKAQNARNEENRTNGLALNGDAQLIQLAQKFASCLKAQGIPVSTTQPTGMADMVRLDLANQLPEDHRSLTKAEALPLLTKDIDVSLKDLECGKKFRAAYFPKEKAHPYWGDGQ